VQFIRANHERPFFLYFPHYGVHTPLQGKPEVVAKYEKIPVAQQQGKPVYAAMVESIDDSVGRVVATLRELGLEQTTVIVFTSDNGGFWNATSNAPLRANKGASYEGGIRVPLIVKWPGVARPGLVSSEPVTSPDLYPTLLAAAGQPLRPSQHRDGLDLSPVLTDSGTLGRSALFWHFPHYNEHPSSVPSSVIRKGAWKLIETFDPEGIELFNLADDLAEKNNLVSAQPTMAADLRRELAAWRTAVGAQLMEPNPDYDPSVQRREKGGKKK
jgi:arylsulfatase A